MHHKQYAKFQADYKSDVHALVDAFKQLGNPFWKTVASCLIWTSQISSLQMW